MKIWLKPDGPDEVSVRTGDYERTVSRAEGKAPLWEVTEEEWLRILAPTGKFTTEKPTKKKPGAAPREATPAPEAPPEAAKEAKEG